MNVKQGGNIVDATSIEHTITSAWRLFTAATLLSFLLIRRRDLHSLRLLRLVVESASLLVLALHDGLGEGHERLIDVGVGLSGGFSEGNAELLSKLLTLFC